MNTNEVSELVAFEISSLRDGRLLERVKTHLIVPFTQERHFEWIENESTYTIWIVCETTVKNVAIAFTDGGFAKNGFPWGIIFKDQEGSGSPNCWYKTLNECITDSTCFEED